MRTSVKETADLLADLLLLDDSELDAFALIQDYEKARAYVASCLAA